MLPATVFGDCRKTVDLGTLAPLFPGDAGAPIAGDFLSAFLGTLAPLFPEGDQNSGPLSDERDRTDYGA